MTLTAPSSLRSHTKYALLLHFQQKKNVVAACKTIYFTPLSKIVAHFVTLMIRTFRLLGSNLLCDVRYCSALWSDQIQLMWAIFCFLFFRFHWPSTDSAAIKTNGFSNLKFASRDLRSDFSFKITCIILDFLFSSAQTDSYGKQFDLIESSHDSDWKKSELKIKQKHRNMINYFCPVILNVLYLYLIAVGELFIFFVVVVIIGAIWRCKI